MRKRNVREGRTDSDGGGDGTCAFERNSANQVALERAPAPETLAPSLDPPPDSTSSRRLFDDSTVGGANSQVNVNARLDAWHGAFSGAATTLSGLLGRVRATFPCAASPKRSRVSQSPGDPPGLWDRSGAWAEPCRGPAHGPTIHRSKGDPVPGKRARLGCGRMFHKGKPGEVNRPLQGYRVAASRAVSALGLLDPM
jgi:hypothetical protein